MKISFYQNDGYLTLKDQSLLGVVYDKICEDNGRLLKKVDITFHLNEALLAINKQFLNHDYFTDIITFDFSRKDKVIGELHISVDFIQNFARENQIGFRDELLRVCIHGMLHLVGFDDISKKDQLVMREKEDFYLKSALSNYQSSF